MSAAASPLGPDHPRWRVACALALVPVLLGLGIVRIHQGRALLRMPRRR